jgi:hypothetical protein
LVEIKDKGKGRNNVGSTETQQEKRKKRRNAVEYATIKERKGKDGKKKRRGPGKLYLINHPCHAMRKQR